MIELELPKKQPFHGGKSSGVVVAIDAGATKTRALSFDLASGATADGIAGSGNQQSVGTSAAVSNISDAILAAAGGQEVHGILLACAGTDLHEVQAGIEQRFASVEYLDVVNDVIGAWGSAFLGGDGMTIISGTGSHAVGVFNGTAARVGGWGHMFGDEGSGWGLGRAAVIAMLYALDGRGPQTALTELICKKFDGEDPDAVVAGLYASDNLKADTAQIAQLVDAAAIDGDAVAQSIIAAGAEQLAAHIDALDAALPSKPEARIGLVGSTWHSDALFDAFRAALQRRDGHVSTFEPERVSREPVRGVLALLLGAIGVPLPAGLMDS